MIRSILPLFFLPSGLSLLLILVGLLFRKRTVSWAGFLLLWLSSTPLVSTCLMRSLEGNQLRTSAKSAPKVAGIVVLSGMLTDPPGPVSTEWNEAVDRFEAGVELFQAGRAPLLIFTGGWSPWNPKGRPEGEVLAEQAVRRGVPKEQIRVTENVSNTAAEARAIAELLSELKRPQQEDSILLVTSAFHMRRASLLFEHEGLTLLPYPVDFRLSDSTDLNLLDFLANSRSLRQTDVAVKEIYAYLFYQLLFFATGSVEKN